MLYRPSEMEAKKRNMKRLSDPKADITDRSGRDVKEEVEERREIDRAGTPQEGPAGSAHEKTRVKRS